ncbi:hypothetical protein J6590_046403 [Homalodisca vitripennis]|nr:hypothetical protein J6590_046403 [Homalodisca vitripennis]
MQRRAPGPDMEPRPNIDVRQGYPQNRELGAALRRVVPEMAQKIVRFQQGRSTTTPPPQTRGGLLLLRSVANMKQRVQHFVRHQTMVRLRKGWSGRKSGYGLPLLRSARHATCLQPPHNSEAPEGLVRQQVRLRSAAITKRPPRNMSPATRQ